MSDTRHAEYTADWENFWRDAAEGKTRILWDAPAERTVVEHATHFEKHFNTALPTVDLGCGNGTQTAGLARRHVRALGFDLTTGAVGLARAAHPDVDFRRLDATDADAMRDLHEELGDVNLYVRGVLHQCDLEYRRRVVRGMAALLGDRGHAFVVQPSEKVKDVLAELDGKQAELSPLLRAHVDTRVARMGLSDEVLPALFTAEGMKVADQGELTHTMPQGAAGEAPIVLRSVWLIAGLGG